MAMLFHVLGTENITHEHKDLPEDRRVMVRLIRRSNHHQ